MEYTLYSDSATVGLIRIPHFPLANSRPVIRPYRIITSPLGFFSSSFPFLSLFLVLFSFLSLFLPFSLLILFLLFSPTFSSPVFLSDQRDSVSLAHALSGNLLSTQLLAFASSIRSHSLTLMYVLSTPRFLYAYGAIHP